MASELGATIVLLQEPNRRKTAHATMLHDPKVDTAVAFPHRLVQVCLHTYLPSVTAVSFPDWDLYNLYTSPNITWEEFTTTIEQVMELIITTKSPLWGSPASDRRGAYLEDWAAQLQLEVINKGN